MKSKDLLHLNIGKEIKGKLEVEKGNLLCFEAHAQHHKFSQCFPYIFDMCHYRRVELLNEAVIGCFILRSQ